MKLEYYRNFVKQHTGFLVKQVAEPSWSNYHHGKVRDSYDLNNGERLIITTDRQSAHDELWGYVPFKGMVLTQVSQFWFDRLQTICDNHFIRGVDPNAMLVKKVRMLPIEFVVRGYLTGSTVTSIWHRYQNGERQFGPLQLADALPKNTPLPQCIVTPTTKAAEGHDAGISKEQLIEQAILTNDQWQQLASVSLALFKEGQKLARERGFILVDTKYEFGIDKKNNIVLADELHTPDSSRYWSRASYEANPTAPEHFDKEVLRLWLAKRNLKAEPQELQTILSELAARYLYFGEILTGKEWELETRVTEDPVERILRNVNAARKASLRS